MMNDFVALPANWESPSVSLGPVLFLDKNKLVQVTESLVVHEYSGQGAMPYRSRDDISPLALATMFSTCS